MSDISSAADLLHFYPVYVHRRQPDSSWPISQTGEERYFVLIGVGPCSLSPLLILE